MSRATLTLRGMMAANPNLFKDMVVPAEIDKDVLVDRIMLDCNNFQVLFPHAEYFQYMIGRWSKSRLDVWERLEATRHYDYTPYHNYDRHETETSTRDGKYKTDTTLDHTHNTDTSNDKTQNIDTTGHEDYSGEMSFTDDVKDTTTTTVAGYNSSGSEVPDNKVNFVDHKDHKQSESSESDRTGNEKLTAGETGNEHNTAKDVGVENRKEDWQDDRGLYAYGNIGVTTTQQLITEQREVDLFNLYEIISNEFASQFMILVY